MKSRSLSFPLIFFIFSSFVQGQSTDFGIWYKLDAEYSFTKKIEVDGSAMIRTFNNGSKIETAFLEGSVSYKFNKNLSIAGAYRFNKSLEDDGALHTLHKWIADIKGDTELGRLDLSGRFRFQRQDKTYFEDADDEIPDYHARIKFKTVYKTPSFPINPNISVETFSRLFEATEKRIDKYRISVGFEYSINKKNSFEVEYMFEQDYLPHLKNIHLIVLTYDININ